MSSPNGKPSSPTLSDPIDSLESNFKAVVDYLMAKAPPDTASSKAKPTDASVTSFASKAGKMAKEHPLAAIGAALGLGYLFMRLIRR